MEQQQRRPGRPKLEIVRDETRLPKPGLPRNFIKNTERERAFLKRAAERRKGVTIIRHGWPDFMLIESGKVYCVEIKSHADEPLGWRQRQTAAALDVAGIETFVWSPQRPDRLVPWRRWAQTKAARSRVAISKGRGRTHDGLVPPR